MGFPLPPSRLSGVRKIPGRFAFSYPLRHGLTALSGFMKPEPDLILELPFPCPDNAYYGYSRSGQKFISERGRRFRDVCAGVISQRGIETIWSNCLEVSIELYARDGRTRDGHNVHKCLFDSLQHVGLLWDDSCVKIWHGRLNPDYIRPDGLCVVKIWDLEPMDDVQKREAKERKHAKQRKEERRKATAQRNRELAKPDESGD